MGSGWVMCWRWEQFDWDERVVRLVTGKTGRVLLQPMQPGFFAWARERFEVAQEAGGDAAVWVLPRLRLHSNPSAEFTQLVRLFGIGLVGHDAAAVHAVYIRPSVVLLRQTVERLPEF